MATSDMLLQLIANLQRDVTAKQGRRTLLKYICASSGARLALLFVVDKEHQALNLLDRWGRRSQRLTPSGEKTHEKGLLHKRIPASGLFGAVLDQPGLIHIASASTDARILPEERYWIGRYDQLILSKVGEQQGVLVLCFEPEYTPRQLNDPLAVLDERNLLICVPLLSAYLSTTDAHSHPPKPKIAH